LAYCVPRGLPHSAFLSWDQDDQDKALAWEAERRAHCPDCGTRRDEWDPDRGGDRYAYLAVDYRCLGCESLEQAQRDRDQTQLGMKVALLRQGETIDDAC
jgi:hypothetical protein